MVSEPVIVPWRVRPGVSAGSTRRSSGAQPIKAQPSDVISAKRDGVGVGPELVVTVVRVVAVAEGTGVVVSDGMGPVHGIMTRVTLMQKRLGSNSGEGYVSTMSTGHEIW